MIKAWRRLGDFGNFLDLQANLFVIVDYTKKVPGPRRPRAVRCTTPVPKGIEAVPFGSNHRNAIASDKQLEKTAHR